MKYQRFDINKTQVNVTVCSLNIESFTSINTLFMLFKNHNLQIRSQTSICLRYNFKISSLLSLVKVQKTMKTCKMRGQETISLLHITVTFCNIKVIGDIKNKQKYYTYQGKLIKSSLICGIRFSPLKISLTENKILKNQSIHILVQILTKKRVKTGLT